MQTEFGFNVPQGAAWEALFAFARTAERVGIDHIWTNDHVLGIGAADAPQHEAWTLLSMLAGATSTIRLGHQVLCQGFRNPALLAKAAATFDYLSGGRLEFGVGSGWYSQEFHAYGYGFPSTRTRLQQLDECLHICKRLWADNGVTFEGAHYAVHDATCEPKPAQHPHPRIVIGGGGERVLLRIVAEHADIWNTNQAGLPERARKHDILKRHCEDVGRDPAEIRVAQQLVLTLAETEAEANRKLEAQRAAGGFHDPTLGVWGHPPQVIEQIEAHVAAGVQVFNFTDTIGGGHTPAELELFAAEVLPALRE